MPTTTAPIHEFVKFDQTVTYRIVNVGEDDLKLEFEHQWVVIPAGSERFMPASAVMVWFGHPGARDIDDRQKFRTEEWDRMRRTYNDFTDDGQRFWRFPEVEVYHPNGERVMTVIDDPEGRHLLPVGSAEGQQSDVAILEREIAKLSRTIKSMQAAQTKILEGEQSDESTDQQPDIPGAPEGDSVAKASSEQVNPSGPPVDGANVVKVGPSGRARKSS
jgi:hypothetical protein